MVFHSTDIEVILINLLPQSLLMLNHIVPLVDEFLKNIKNQEIPKVIKNQREMGLDFHLLDLETIKEISEN